MSMILRLPAEIFDLLASFLPFSSYVRASKEEADYSDFSPVDGCCCNLLDLCCSSPAIFSLMYEHPTIWENHLRRNQFVPSREASKFLFAFVANHATATVTAPAWSCSSLCFLDQPRILKAAVDCAVRFCFHRAELDGFMQVRYIIDDFFEAILSVDNIRARLSRLSAQQNGSNDRANSNYYNENNNNNSSSSSSSGTLLDNKSPLNPILLSTLRENSSKFQLFDGFYRFVVLRRLLTALLLHTSSSAANTTSSNSNSNMDTLIDIDKVLRQLHDAGIPLKRMRFYYQRGDEGDIDMAEYGVHNACSLLHLAEIFDNTTAVRTLIDLGFDVNDSGTLYNRTPVYEAIRRCNAEITRLLLENGAKAPSYDDMRISFRKIFDQQALPTTTTTTASTQEQQQQQQQYQGYSKRVEEMLALREVCPQFPADEFEEILRKYNNDVAEQLQSLNKAECEEEEEEEDADDYDDEDDDEDDDDIDDYGDNPYCLVDLHKRYADERRESRKMFRRRRYADDLQWKRCWDDIMEDDDPYCTNTGCHSSSEESDNEQCASVTHICNPSVTDDAIGRLIRDKFEEVIMVESEEDNELSDKEENGGNSNRHHFQFLIKKRKGHVEEDDNDDDTTTTATTGAPSFGPPKKKSRPRSNYHIDIEAAEFYDNEYYDYNYNNKYCHRHRRRRLLAERGSMSIRKHKFSKLIHQILSDMMVRVIKFTPSAKFILQDATEHFIVSLLAAANDLREQHHAVSLRDFLNAKAMLTKQIIVNWNELLPDCPSSKFNDPKADEAAAYDSNQQQQQRQQQRTKADDDSDTDSDWERFLRSTEAEAKAEETEDHDHDQDQEEPCYHHHYYYYTDSEEYESTDSDDDDIEQFFGFRHTHTHARA